MREYILQLNVLKTSVDFTKYGAQRPIRVDMEEFNALPMKLDGFIYSKVTFQRNEAFMEDSIYVPPYGLLKTSDTFFDVVKVTTANMDPLKLTTFEGGVQSIIVGAIDFKLDLNKAVHERTAFTLLDLLGEYGGLKEGLTILIALFISNIPGHLYSLKVIQKLFFARTSDERLFKSVNRESESK